MLLLLPFHAGKDIPPASITAFDADCVDFINEAPANVSCHRLILPIDHLSDDRQTIEIPLLVARANAGKQSQSAILIPGGGGPGSPVGFGYLYAQGEFLAYYQSLLDAGYDIVFADQRGAGLSTPMLACEESVADFRRLVQAPFSLTESMRIQRESAQSCRARLTREGVNLARFDTRQSAADFLAAIDYLAYERWHLLATSYATAIAQAMLLSRPDGFTSVVLDSPVPLDYQQPLSQSLIRHGIRKTIDLCTSRDRCNQRYPGIAEKFDAVLARATRKPYKVKILVNDEQGRASKKTLVVDQHLLAGILFTALYSNESIRQLPDVIDRLHSGLAQALNPFAEVFWYQGVDIDYADGLYLSVHCRERQQLEADYAMRNPEALQALDADSLALLENQRLMCDIWQAGTDDELNTPAVFQTPTLLLAGRLDPIITALDIANTADNFRNVQVLQEASSGHAVWHQSECARQKVIGFFNGQPVENTRCTPDKMQFD